MDQTEQARLVGELTERIVKPRIHEILEKNLRPHIHSVLEEHLPHLVDGILDKHLRMIVDKAVDIVAGPVSTTVPRLVRDRIESAVRAIIQNVTAKVAEPAIVHALEELAVQGLKSLAEHAFALVKQALDPDRGMQRCGEAN